MNRLLTVPPSTNGVNGHSDGQPAPPAPKPAPADGRDGAGRFTAGNHLGRGNPFARQVADRRKALLGAVTAADVAAVAKKLRDLALAGDVAAAKVLLSYVVGKPAEVTDPDRLDLNELALLREFPTLADLFGAHLQRAAVHLPGDPIAPHLAIEQLAPVDTLTKFQDLIERATRVLLEERRNEIEGDIDDCD
jgi:hypothetical protein